MKPPLLFEVSCPTYRALVLPGEFPRSRFQHHVGYPEIPREDYVVRAVDPRKRWPDAISSYPLGMIISEKVVRDIWNAGITLHVGDVDLQSEIKQPVPPPNYYYMCLRPGIEGEPDTPMLPPNHRLKFETWTGEDIFVLKGRPRRLLCSFRIVELARAGKWTGFEFRVSPSVLVEAGQSAPPVREIDYLAPKRHWPPEWLRPLF